MNMAILLSLITHSPGYRYFKEIPALSEKAKFIWFSLEWAIQDARESNFRI